MKDRRVFMFLLIAGSIFFSFCKKKNDATDSNNQSMSAIISGSAFSASGTGISETTQSSGGYYPTYSYNFSGVQGSTSLGLYISSPSIGTYNFGVTTYSPAIQYSSSNGKTYFTKKAGAATKGSIIITSAENNKIGGIFSGTLFTSSSTTDSVVITSGQFSNLVYQ